MTDLPILSIIIFIPIITLVFLLPLAANSTKNSRLTYVRYVALLATILTFIASLYLLFSFDFNNPKYQFIESYNVFNIELLRLSLAVDSIALCFVMLTTLLSSLVMFYSIGRVKLHIKNYLLNFLILEVCLLGLFCTTNLLLFYIFFEFVLIPMYLIIGIWGGENKSYAAIKFFLYTFLASLFVLVGIIYLGLELKELDLKNLPILTQKLPLETQRYLWWAAFIAFAVKTPMIPLHTWLPDAHVQAPTGGSVMLAAILLKIGGYGLLRFCLQLFPIISFEYQNFVIILSIIAIIYASVVAYGQTDMKKLVAYSSISHMGYATAALFTMTKTGISAAIFQMLSHGLISAGLFFIVGMLYDRLHTKEIRSYGGVAAKMPIMAIFFMLFTLANIGLPGTSGFIGELLSLFSIFEYNKLYSVIACFGVVLSAIYMLNLYRALMLGPILNPKVNKMIDITYKESIILAPIIILILYIGIFPNVINDIYFLPTMYMEFNIGEGI